MTNQNIPDRGPLTVPSTSSSPTPTPSTPPSTPPVVVEAKEEKFGPWDIVSEEFFPYNDSHGPGMSVVAILNDPSGVHELEYSVSFYVGIDEYERLIVAAETEEDLQERLRVAVVTQVNDPRRSLLINSRFAKNKVSS